MKKRKFWLAVGPVLLAAAFSLILLFSPLSVTPRYSQDQLKQAANNPSNRANFVGYSAKEQAFSNENFLPILGSSELEKLDPYHPSVFAQKYNTSYIPYLVGQPGTQSLPLYFYTASISSQLKNRKIIMIISPQWFSSNGISPAALTNFVPKGAVYDWLWSANPSDSTTQEMARRLLTFKGFSSDLLIKNSLQKFAKGQAVSTFERTAIKLASSLWQNEDDTFSYFNNFLTKQVNQENTISNLSKSLPSTLDFSQLDQEATKSAEKATEGNPYYIRTSVWNTYFKTKLARYKNQQSRTSYLQSPEYADFQQLLNFFAANNDDVQFIIQPINGAWAQYSGLSADMMDNFTQKITYQLQSQGFNNITDMTTVNNDPYYVGDTIHLGYRGWVAVDKAMDDFMKSNQPFDYKLNNQLFLSKDWQNNKISTQ